MTVSPRCSVVVRTKNEAPFIARVLDLLAAQTLAEEGGLEVIVVDSGSTDHTLAVVHARPEVRLIEIPAESFTYGGALNTGAEAATAPIIAALSAHALPYDDHWLERLVACFDDPQVAAASGELVDWDDEPLTSRRVQDLELAQRNPYWGYSNVAGAFRAELWREHPFRTDLAAAEDKEFAWHWLHEGRTVAIDPELAVEHDHDNDPLVVVYRRSRAKWLAFSMYLEVPDYPPSALARDWWTGRGPWRSHARARLSPRRATELLGRYAGLRAGKRLRERS